MSDMHKNGLRMTSKQTSSQQETRGKMLAADATDEIMTQELPVIGISRVRSTATSRVFSSSQFATDSTWMADEQTWMLPAIPRSVKGSIPATQGDAKGSQPTRMGAQSYLALALDMVKNSGIYAVGALASPLVSLILTPFLAHTLSTTDYGGLSVLYTVVDLVTVITQLGVADAFFRAYNSDYDSPRDRLGVLSTTLLLVSLITIPIAIVMMSAAPWLSELLFNSPSFSAPVRFTALVIVMENLTLPGISWLRAEKRAILYTVLSIANMLAVLGTNVVLVGGFHLGVNGALIAKGAGYGIVIVCTFPMMFLLLARKQALRLRPDIVQSMLFFGVPTIFGDIAAWVLQLSDRYLLSHFGSLAQTASYSVAYVLGGVLAPVVLAPWGLAWVPVMYAIAKRDDAAHIFRLVFRWWSCVLLFAAFGLSLVSSVVLELLFPPSYRAAEPVIPLITLSTMLNGVWYIFMIGVNIRRKTILDFIYLFIAAVVNVLLNLFLIPRFGAIGAAVATLIAYTVLVVVSYIVNEKIYSVKFAIGSFTFTLAIGIALDVGSSFLAHTQPPSISRSITIVALILYGVFLLWFTGIPVKKLIEMFRYVQKALGKEERSQNGYDHRKIQSTH